MPVKGPRRCGLHGARGDEVVSLVAERGSGATLHSRGVSVAPKPPRSYRDEPRRGGWSGPGGRRAKRLRGRGDKRPPKLSVSASATSCTVSIRPANPTPAQSHRETENPTLALGMGILSGLLPPFDSVVC
jgi:hypothetical protein